MIAGRRYAEYRCDVCSGRIGARGIVLFSLRGFIADAFCRPHRRCQSFGRFDRS